MKWKSQSFPDSRFRKLKNFQKTCFMKWTPALLILKELCCGTLLSFFFKEQIVELFLL